MDPDAMIARLVALGEKIPDALSDILKEARVEGLKEPVLDTMLDGISARGKAIVQQYSA
ncbi:type II toxin-antitoxin system HipA family toxin [Bradyrhizobium vignae]|uniref:type II toxin-antitoxin system HipA family toxin n=1 Tax=Bradyrhizobium vignae TaxID=1549949 RepID=UPI0013E8EE2E|nr:type II toxin-antitoxin system HipA family toxin [Bradyrhizobium vignae]